MDNTDATKCPPPSDTSLDNEYNQQVDKRLEEDSPEVFGNFSYKNAQYIIPRFIESANESVTIFAGSIPEGFYTSSKEPNDSPLFGAIGKAAANIAEKKPQGADSSIRIITIDGVQNPKFVEFAKKTNEEHKCPIIKIIEAKYKGNQKLNHYLVVDHKRYRLEEYHTPFGNKPPDILKAEVCCNDPEKAEIMERSFNRIWSVLNSCETK